MTSENRTLVDNAIESIRHRIAEGLDRGHSAIVEKVAVEVCPTVLTIKAIPRFAEADLSLECWDAMEQADVLAKVMGREILIEAAV